MHGMCDNSLRLTKTSFRNVVTFGKYSMWDWKEYIL